MTGWPRSASILKSKLASANTKWPSACGFQGRDFRLTDVTGNVAKGILA